MPVSSHCLLFTLLIPHLNKILKKVCFFDKTFLIVFVNVWKRRSYGGLTYCFRRIHIYLHPNMNKIGLFVVSLITPLQFLRYSSSVFLMELALSPKPHFAIVSNVNLCNKLKEMNLHSFSILVLENVIYRR